MSKTNYAVYLIINSFLGAVNLYWFAINIDAGNLWLALFSGLTAIFVLALAAHCGFKLLQGAK